MAQRNKTSILVIPILGLTLFAIMLCGGMFLKLVSNVGASRQTSADTGDKAFATSTSNSPNVPQSAKMPTPSQSVGVPSSVLSTPKIVDNITREIDVDSLISKIQLPREQLFRQWTSANGQFKTKAKLITFSNGKVKLEKEAGDPVEVPVSKLSDADQQHIAMQIKSESSAMVIFDQVSRVVDGDSVEIDQQFERVFSAHLFGLKAPTGEEYFANEAAEILKAKLKDHTPWLEWKPSVGQAESESRLFLDGRNINLELVAEGAAAMVETGNQIFDDQLKNAESLARLNKLGIWSK